MRILIVLTFLMVLDKSLFAQSDIMFDEYFIDKNLRIDYHHTGDAEFELVTVDQLYGYGVWAGSTKNLIDNFNNGAYYYKVFDTQSGKLIYSKGFDSYFKEYQTSDKALKGVKKTYHESALIPYPKNAVKFVIEKRDNQNILKEIFAAEIYPDDLYIIHDPVKDARVTVYDQFINGHPHHKVDIVILAEGYTAVEQIKFEKDLERFANALKNHEPFKRNKDKLNIYGVFKPSEESGCDEPGAGIYKSTVLNSTYYSLGSERYLLTEDNKTMRDLAAHVTYDAIFIMVNHNRYGGGGIYNFFCTFVSDNQFSDYLFLHEFGHSFAGLADEYYTSEVAYNEFYPKDVEPVEPNITRLFDKENLKWKHLISKDIDIPSPWEKDDFDKMDLAWQKERREMNKNIARLKLEKAPSNEIEEAQNEYNEKDKLHSEAVDLYLKQSKFAGKVGVFEGAGYSSIGMYRPMLDCLMFSKGTKPFCAVCEEHVEEVINFFAGE
jgi:hypothetical protein